MSFDLLALIDEFLEYLEVERNVSPLTIRDYRHYLKIFANWSTDNASLLSPSDLTIELINKYQSYLANRRDRKNLTLSLTTQNFYMIALKGFLRYLIGKGLPVVTPEKIKLPKTQSRFQKFLSRNQVENLLNSPNTSTPQGLRDKAILELLFSTGLRVSDFVRLNRSQVQLERDELEVTSKNNKKRLTFLSDRAAWWLKNYLVARKDNYSPLFIRHSGSQEAFLGGEKMRLTPRSVQRLLERYAKEANLPIKATPQSLRNAFAVALITSYENLKRIKRITKSKHIFTTQIYTHVANF